MVIKIFKSLLLILLFFSVLEICARLDDWIKWRVSPIHNYSQDNLSIVDELGFRNRPNAQFEKWKINKYGFRGIDFNLEKPEGVKRIMILGASESFGLYENEEMEYPAQLQKLLDKKRPRRYQVINAAVPGISPPRLLHLYQNWLYKFKPDQIYYYPSPSIYLLTNPPGPVLPGYTTKVADQSLQFRIRNKINTIVKQFLPIHVQTAMKRHLINRAIASAPKESIFHKPPSDRLNLFKIHLNQLVTAIETGGTQATLVTHASRVSNPISDEEWQVLTGWRKLYPHVSENCFVEMEAAGNKIIKQVALLTGSSIVDADSQIPSNAKNFADHIHFTNDGATIMARLLAEQILHSTK